MLPTRVAVGVVVVVAVVAVEVVVVVAVVAVEVVVVVAVGAVSPPGGGTPICRRA